MKERSYVKTGIAVLTTAGVLLASCAFGKVKDGPITVSGAISDSQCAFNVHSDSHSHEWMEKKGVYGAQDDKSCTQKCVKDMGGKYVLVMKNNDVYRLDDQVLPDKYAGVKVKVTGTLDTKTNTLHVLKIEEDK